MTQSNPTTTPRSLREQAVFWIVRLHSGSATSGDRRELDAWLMSNPEHRREFDEVSRMWAVLDDTQPLLYSEIHKAEHLWADHHERKATSRWSRWRWGQAAPAAMVLFLILVAAWWWTGLPETMLYETAKGAQRQVSLMDGSTVTLNTDTRMTVEFSRDERLIRLERGEAWFTVSPGQRRPFTVRVANGTIRDIGTQFVVNKSSGDVRVLVWEGIVEVGVQGNRAGIPMPRPAVLHAGQQLSYGADGGISDISVFDRNRAASWKEGKLIFRSQPLKQVLEEIARYRPEDIRLLDPSLEAFPVSGVFNIQELDHAMETLQAALPIRVQRVQDNLILIESAPPSSKSRVSSRHSPK